MEQPSAGLLKADRCDPPPAKAPKPLSPHCGSNHPLWCPRCAAPHSLIHSIPLPWLAEAYLCLL